MNFIIIGCQKRLAVFLLNFQLFIKLVIIMFSAVYGLVSSLDRTPSKMLRIVARDDIQLFFTQNARA